MRDHATYVLICIATIALFSACGSVPPTYYYRVAEESSASTNNALFEKSLEIAPFTADVLYQTDQIVYRNSEYQAQFYHYHRWIAPPQKLVTERVLQFYRYSNMFDRVVKMTSPLEVDYVLQGNISSFEEWDESDKWFGLVTIQFSLLDASTQEVLWEKTISEKTPSAKREPVAVVEAISKSLNKVVEQSASEIGATLKTSKTVELSN